MVDALLDMVYLEMKGLGEAWGKRRMFCKPDVRMDGVVTFFSTMSLFWGKRGFD